MHRHVLGAVLAHVALRRVEGDVGGVRLGRAGEIDRQLRQRQFALGTAESVVGFPGLDRHLRARADRPGRRPRPPSASAAARGRSDRSRHRASASASTAPHRDWNCAPTCAAPRSGRRTVRRPCRSGACGRPAPVRRVAVVTAPPSPTSSAAISSRVSARRTSPSAATAIRRSCSSSTCRPRPPSPRSASVSACRSATRMSSADTDSITCTRQRDSSAEFSSNDGFSVVAPTNRMVPRSICGRNASCCALLKRCTSSTNRTVRRPSAKRCAGLGQHLAYFRQAGEHGGHGAEFGVGVSGEQQGQRGLAAAGRPPQHHRVHVSGLDRLPQRGAGREQAALPDHLVQRARADAFGQRPQRVAVDAQQVAGRFGRMGGAGTGHEGPEGRGKPPTR